MRDPINLADTLRRAASLPRLVLVSTPAISGGARADTPTRCTPGPALTIGADVLDGVQPAAAATLAHEVAHHELGHTTNPMDYVAVYAQRVVAFAAVVAAATDSWLALAVCAALALTIRLMTDAMYRGQEYGADARAVALLDEAGVGGQAAMAAMHAVDMVRDPWWHVAGGWVLSGHPPVHARARRLAGLRR